MMFIKGSHQEGFFDHVQSTKKGNVLNENQDMIIPERFRDKIVQSELEPGEASFHDGKFAYRVLKKRIVYQNTGSDTSFDNYRVIFFIVRNGYSWL